MSPPKSRGPRKGRLLATASAAAKPPSIAMPPSRGVGIACTSRSRTCVMAPHRSAIRRATGVSR